MKSLMNKLVGRTSKPVYVVKTGSRVVCECETLEAAREMVKRFGKGYFWVIR